MTNFRRFCSFSLTLLAIVTAPRVVSAHPPVIAATQAMPTLTGGHDPLTLTPSALEFNVLGSQFIRDVGNSTGGILLESGSPDLTFEHLRITSNDVPSFTVLPVLGDNANGLFTQTWVETPITDGVSLDWQPGAPMLGQGVAGPNGVHHYDFIFELDPAANAGIDLTAFDAATFTIAAVPEPGLPLWGSALLLGGALLLRRAREPRRS